MLSSLLYSVTGAVYDVFHHIRPDFLGPHDGMLFSTPYDDYDLTAHYNCALSLGGSWWFSDCSIWTMTTVNPMWYSLGDSTFYVLKKARMMVKLQ